jgi:hypothetical protein
MVVVFRGVIIDWFVYLFCFVLGSGDADGASLFYRLWVFRGLRYLRYHRVKIKYDEPVGVSGALQQKAFFSISYT